MGYSLAVSLKSKPARDEMFAFLGANLRPWSTLTEPYKDNPEVYCSPDFDPTRWLCLGKDLDYDRGTTKIGFNQSMTGHHTVCILRWASLRLGRRRKFKKFDILVPVPYIVYDGYEGWPTLYNYEWPNCPEKAKWCLVDRHGFKPENRWWKHRPKGSPPLTADTKKYIKHEEKVLKIKDQLMHAELKRLTKLWEMLHK